MKLLGAIIAGGKSQRFNGDKAAALLGGRALIEHVRDALAPQVDMVVACGRDWPGIVGVADRPAPFMGPLGGLCGALKYAADHGYEGALTAGCDTFPVPDLRGLIGAAPAVFQGQRLFGFWDVGLLAPLDRHLNSPNDRSLRNWIIKSGARSVASTVSFYNLNTREDLALYCALKDQASNE